MERTAVTLIRRPKVGNVGDLIDNLRKYDKNTPLTDYFHVLEYQDSEGKVIGIKKRR